jgi:hypothetical protein
VSTARVFAELTRTAPVFDATARARLRFAPDAADRDRFDFGK